MFKKVKTFSGFNFFKHYPTVLLRGLAPAPPVSLATPRGQGSPLRFDTQPTGWSVGSAPRCQGGIRKDCSAALLNLYKASPLTPFRFPLKPNSAWSGRRSRRAARGRPGKARRCLANVPGELPGESPAVQVSANVPGEAGGRPEDSSGRPNQSFLPPKTINPAEIVANTIMMYLIFSANPQTWSYLNS